MTTYTLRTLFAAAFMLGTLTTAQAVSQSGFCESLAGTAKQAAEQRDAGVSLRESLDDITSYGTILPEMNQRARAIIRRVSTQYNASVRAAYAMPTLSPAEVFAVIDRKCMANASPAEALPASSTPSPAALPARAAALTFGDDVWEQAFGMLTVKGLIKNTSTAPVQWVHISVRGLDQAGHLVAIEEAYASPYHLAPGQEATYTVRFAPGVVVAKLHRTVSWR